jgi:outer membrane murein-binding lipoprotein Lpp
MKRVFKLTFAVMVCSLVLAGCHHHRHRNQSDHAHQPSKTASSAKKAGET